MSQLNPTHAIVCIGYMTTAGVAGTKKTVPAVIYRDNTYVTITEEAKANWIPSGALTFGVAMHAAMQGYRVQRTGDHRLVQYHAGENEMAVNIGQQSFAAYTPTAADMVTADWMIVDEALIGRIEDAAPAEPATV